MLKSSSCGLREFFANFAKLLKFFDMKKNVPPFRFKKFECSHSRSSMKIGIDAVLLGAWINVEGVHSVLEVGCGCGVISMQLAERLSDSTDDFHIVAIDIDQPSIEEASGNFSRCPWRANLKAIHIDFLKMAALDLCKESLEPDKDEPGKDEKSYDLIVSNPPYFESGITNPDTARLLARHQSDLSPISLIRHAADMQKEGGRVALVLPIEQSESTIEAAAEAGYHPIRRTDFRGHPHAPWKRSLLEFAKQSAPSIGNNPIPKKEDNALSCEAENLKDNGLACKAQNLTLEAEPGIPSEEHLRLCRRFYLKW